MPSEFPLTSSTPAALNFRPRPLADLDKLIRTHIDEMRYPGCQIALARHGQLALYRTYGDARRDTGWKNTCGASWPSYGYRKPTRITVGS